MGEKIQQALLIGDVFLKDLFTQFVKLAQGHHQSSTSGRQRGEGACLVGSIRPEVIAADVVGRETSPWQGWLRVSGIFFHQAFFIGLAHTGRLARFFADEVRPLDTWFPNPLSCGRFWEQLAGIEPSIWFRSLDFQLFSGCSPSATAERDPNLTDSNQSGSNDFRGEYFTSSRSVLLREERGKSDQLLQLFDWICSCRCKNPNPEW